MAIVSSPAWRHIAACREIYAHSLLTEMTYIPPLQPQWRRPVQRIGLVVFPGIQVMGLAATSVFEFANIAAGEVFYDVRLLSETGGCVRTSMGLGLETTALDASAHDTLIVGGGTVVEPSTP